MCVEATILLEMFLEVALLTLQISKTVKSEFASSFR